jgi:hypothetical protein
MARSAKLRALSAFARGLRPVEQAIGSGRNRSGARWLVRCSAQTMWFRAIVLVACSSAWLACSGRRDDRAADRTGSAATRAGSGSAVAAGSATGPGRATEAPRDEPPVVGACSVCVRAHACCRAARARGDMTVPPCSAFDAQACEHSGKVELYVEVCESGLHAMHNTQIKECE